MLEFFLMRHISGQNTIIGNNQRPLHFLLLLNGIAKQTDQTCYKNVSVLLIVTSADLTQIKPQHCLED